MNKYSRNYWRFGGRSIAHVYPRSGQKHKDWGVSPRNSELTVCKPADAGDSAITRFAGSRIFAFVTWGLRPRLYASARFAGSIPRW